MRRDTKQAFINQEEISHYLKDIRKLTVLTPKREKQLAEKIEQHGIGIGYQKLGKSNVIK